MPVSALSTTTIIGDFGLPVGTVARIRCHLVANPDAGKKTGRSMAPYMLAVSVINDRRLDSPLMVDFKVSSQSQSSIPIFQSPLQFSQAEVAGTKTKPSIEAGKQIARQWLGRQIDCLAYETGAFAGHPRYTKELAPRTMTASQGFHFHRYIVLIDRSDW
ncbi:MAG: hypothetical protein NXI04_29045 [Planctomycetaceae bacterium]|nr:hypothetical protein [Planctomycetaceae bacterium]